MVNIDIWQELINLDEAYKAKDFLKDFKRPPLFFRELFYFLLTLLSKILFKAEIRGVENIPAKGPYIVAANHASAADYPLVAWAMPRDVRNDLYAITTSYFYDQPLKHPFIMMVTNSIRIDTKGEFEPALQASAKVLAQGGSIYINPEGTWSEDGKLMEFKPGVGLLAYELKVPIVPVYIGGTYEMLPPHAIFPKRRGHITVAFGKPISPDRYSGAEGNYFVYKKIADDVREEIVNLRDKKAGI